MKNGLEFIQRIQEDAEFRRKVHACADGEERLAFLRSEGYDFSPFIQILNKLSTCNPPAGKVAPSGEGAALDHGASGFLSRVRKLFHGPKGPPLER